MALPLPNPEGDSNSVRGEIRDVLAAIRRYRACEFPHDVEKIIHDVAMNPEASRKVLDKPKFELPASHVKYFRIQARLWGIYLLLIFVLALLGPILPVRQFVYNDLAILIIILDAELFILEYLSWRIDFRDAYIAHFLIRTLEFGLRYHSAPTDERLRDGLAQMLQRTAFRYAIAYKRADSSRFFAAQVRRQAKDCRNDIITLIPGLVTADQAEIRKINENLARLLIRTQLGYWYQTSDIAKSKMPMRRSDTLRISLSSFIKDRSIQVAFIALTATIVAAIIGLVVHAT